MSQSQSYHLALFSDVKISGTHHVYLVLSRKTPVVGFLLSNLRCTYAAFYDKLGIGANQLQLNVFPDAPPPINDPNLKECIRQRRAELQAIDHVTPLDTLPNVDTPHVIQGVITYQQYAVELQDNENWCGLSHNLRQADFNQISAVRKGRTKFESPSTYAHSGGGYIKAMDHDVIYNHRANHPAPPIAIFNTALATLVDALNNGPLPTTDLPSNSYKLAWDLCAASADVYASQDERVQELRSYVDGLLAGFVRESQYELPMRIAKPDVVIRPTSSNALAWIEKWKLEVGLGGDAEIEIAVEYVKMVAQEQYKDIRQRTCCPCILLAFSGPLLQIYGAVFTEICIVQPIGEPIRLYGAPPHESRIARVAATFSALRTALRELGTYYTTAMDVGGPDVVPSRLFPSPTPAEELDSLQLNVLGDLEFTGYLAHDGRNSTRDYSRALYTGTFRRQHVVIKFCDRYSREAHTTLFESGLAPRLHLCINVRGGLRMVVMDHIERPWKALTQAYEGQPTIPPETRDAVRSALQRLHQAGLVFGDVRRPNIFVHTTDAKKIMFVDFEFSGKDVRYPLGLNTSSISWVTGVEPGHKIVKEHDIGMCDKL